MRLRKLLATLEDVQVFDFADRNITGITSDSRKVQAGNIFVAIKGVDADGHDFINEAVERGAQVVVAQEKVHVPGDVCLVTASNTRHILAVLADIFWDHPSGKVKVIGITGTNGKTTVGYLVRSILQVAARKTGLLGTINYEFSGRVVRAGTTTPGAGDLQRFLAEMAADEIEYAVLEVSSHALEQYRVDAVDFTCAIFTNITPEHLDYHKTFDAYLNAKGKLFRYLPRESVGVFNADDPNSTTLAQRTKAARVWYGIENEAEVTGELISTGLDGSSVNLHTPAGEAVIRTPLIGVHNVYNILAAATAAVSMGISLDETVAGIEALDGVPGRLERIRDVRGFAAFVDYAHTDDALRNVLTALRPVVEGRLIVVFGCGGDRDRRKRPRMGRVAQDLGDVVVITSDNPRSEAPGDIIDEILAGTDKSDDLYVEPDRKQAIEAACRLARAGDVVLVAGKGHETYQVLRDTVVPFDDRAVIRDFAGSTES
ncbi:MAG: UDP-N-acetylmuramoyl-L-alanyl-D-glutamate--2,6-diaminopimelate ligase [Planctomycetes bacterium]|nr:UDP-N-acetylmuramoyl-L-alanyl-D-glutamate--2,6-diaminopimelate ligase [Planctomycetota bacterium]